MLIEEIIKLPVVGYRLAEANLNLGKEGDDIASAPFPCCDTPDFEFLKAPSWEISKYCKNCNRLVLIFPQDRMGGMYRDPWQVYENPTEDNPLLSFENLNHFLDFCGMVNPYQDKNWSYPNVYSMSGDYKKYMRHLKRTGSPDLIPLYKSMKYQGPHHAEWKNMNINDYDKCREFLERHQVNSGHVFNPEKLDAQLDKIAEFEKWVSEEGYIAAGKDYVYPDANGFIGRDALFHEWRKLTGK